MYIDSRQKQPSQPSLKKTLVTLHAEARQAFRFTGIFRLAGSDRIVAPGCCMELLLEQQQQQQQHQQQHEAYLYIPSKQTIKCQHLQWRSRLESVELVMDLYRHLLDAYLLHESTTVMKVGQQQEVDVSAV